MSADRARLTHYLPRKYREVVSQSGRVLIESDLNEGQRIFSEEARREALDFVGPSGTPDDGYKITTDAGSVEIGPGTMYVGGLRVSLDTAVSYAEQPDWLDVEAVGQWSDGLWVDPQDLDDARFEAMLVLREQEITAVEDPALREVALGGPDTAARTRLLQRVVFLETEASTCAAAGTDAIAVWSAQGLDYDLKTAALAPRARLLVTPVESETVPSPCDPPAASGYLGADNQMIRVQVSARGEDEDSGTLLWGYYNASTLYRATVLGESTLKLATRPVSAEYQPRTGQVVQVLLRAADLGEGAFAAALSGHFAKLTEPYAPDTQVVTLPDDAPLPQPPYEDETDVYVRLWEDTVGFTLDEPVELAGTGLEVTLSRASNGPLHVGDYWCIAVRPLTPNLVYPERLLTTPQPPDGPRMWGCPLAVLSPSEGLHVAQDCRLPFDNLVELTAREPGAGESCACTLCVTPEEQTANPQRLQEAVDELVKAGGGTLCLEVGTYPLDKPLVIDAARSLAVVGQGEASVIAPSGNGILVQNSRDVTLERFTIQSDQDKVILLRCQDAERVRISQLRLTGGDAAGLAISLRKKLSDLSIRDCTVQAQVGIESGADDLSIEDLQVLDCRFDCQGSAIQLLGRYRGVVRLARNLVADCGVGFLVEGDTDPDTGVVICDNEIHARDRALVVSVGRLRIDGNQLMGVDRGQIGISLEPVDKVDGGGDAEIRNNRIENFLIGILGKDQRAFDSFSIAQTQLRNVDQGILLSKLQVGRVSIDQNQLAEVLRQAVAVEMVGGSISMCGNQLATRGADSTPAVVIQCEEGECQYADNHSQQIQGNVGVELKALRLIVSSNRVRGQVNLVLAVPDSKSHVTILGNLVGRDIVLNSALLGAPWLPLNSIHV